MIKPDSFIYGKVRTVCARWRTNPWPAVTGVYCVALFWLSSGPAAPLPGGFPGTDKVLHFAAYLPLAALAALSLERSGRAWSARFLFAGPALFAAAYGLSDEAHQLFVASRQADFLDWVADAAGGTAGAWLMAGTRKYRSAGYGPDWLRPETAARYGGADHA